MINVCESTTKQNQCKTCRERDIDDQKKLLPQFQFLVVKHKILKIKYLDLLKEFNEFQLAAKNVIKGYKEKVDILVKESHKTREETQDMRKFQGSDLNQRNLTSDKWHNKSMSIFVLDNGYVDRNKVIVELRI